jgi:hypothetical protein
MEASVLSSKKELRVIFYSDIRYGESQIDERRW